MKELPILVKPYLTIEETYNRLLQAGASLDKPEDIFLLASEGDLLISLLIDEMAILINVEDVLPYKVKPSKKIFFNQNLIDEYCQTYGGTIESTKKIIDTVNKGDWMIPSSLFGKKNKTQDYKYLYIDGSKPIAVSPYKLEIDYEKGLDHLKGLRLHDCSNPFFYLYDQAVSLFDNQLAAVSYKNEFYFVCEEFDHSNFLTGLTDISLEIGEAEVEYKPHHYLDRDLLTKLIEKDNHVVTRDSIIDFEVTHLGIEHAKAESLPPYLDKNNSSYAIEMDIAIQAHKAVFKDNYGNKYRKPRERAAEWLREHCKELSESDKFVDRITTLITRQIRG